MSPTKSTRIWVSNEFAFRIAIKKLNKNLIEFINLIEIVLIFTREPIRVKLEIFLAT